MDDRPGYADFYHDPERDGEVDEFADELEPAGPGDPRRKGVELSAGTGDQVLVKVLGAVEIGGWRETATAQDRLRVGLLPGPSRRTTGQRRGIAGGPVARGGLRSQRQEPAQLHVGLPRSRNRHVPMARGTGYSILVRCDWTEFTALVKSTELIGVDEVAVLKEALSLRAGPAVHRRQACRCAGPARRRHLGGPWVCRAPGSRPRGPLQYRTRPTACGNRCGRSSLRGNTWSSPRSRCRQRLDGAVVDRPGLPSARAAVLAPVAAGERPRPLRV